MNTNFDFAETDTGEPYQPVRLTYIICSSEKLLSIFNQLECLHYSRVEQCWQWFRHSEASEVSFLDETIPYAPEIILGRIKVFESKFYIYLDSIERACSAILFFDKYFFQENQKNKENNENATLDHVDFSNILRRTKNLIDEQIDGLFDEFLLDRKLTEKKQRFDALLTLTNSDSFYAELIKFSIIENQKKLPRIERYIVDKDSYSSATGHLVGLLLLIDTLMLRLIYAIEAWKNPSDVSLDKILRKRIMTNVGKNLRRNLWPMN